jgi:hypothetical protein
LASSVNADKGAGQGLEHETLIVFNPLEDKE